MRQWKHRAIISQNPELFLHRVHTRMVNIFSQQECMPVGCVPPTRNRMAAVGVSLTEPPGQRPSGQRPPGQRCPMDTGPPEPRPPGHRPPPPGLRPPGLRPPGQRFPLDTDPPPDKDPPGHRPPGQRSPASPTRWTEPQTGVKTLPCRNFCEGSNKKTFK